jgi:hypothetical protein
MDVAVLGPIEVDGQSKGARAARAEVDCRRFERLSVGRGGLERGCPGLAAYLVQEALDLWRGRPLADLEELETGRVEAARLEGLRIDAEGLRVGAQTRGRHARDVRERPAPCGAGAVAGAALGVARRGAAPDWAAGGRSAGCAQADARKGGTSEKLIRDQVPAGHWGQVDS